VRRRVSLFGVIALVVSAFGLLPAHATGRHTWTPARRGTLDCNGFSPVQKPLAHFPCAEIAGREKHGFEDNGHYVGHDEPALNFISHSPGSGSSSKYVMHLPKEPTYPPDGTVSGPVWSFQTRIADWFGMVLCDNQSYPEGSPVCTKNSDTNIQVPPQADHAGTAYLEVQFYPPGDPPFISNISCDPTKWCASVAIFSLQASYGFGAENDNCIEPANFAFLQMDGVPTGPPGPDQATAATFTPNAQTLKMSQGDTVILSIFDTGPGLAVQARDATTGQIGRMVASEANGFRHILWDPVNFTCNGAPYAFHPMYNTAAGPDSNGNPQDWAIWSAHTYNIAYTGEIGHWEPLENPPDDDDSYCPPTITIQGCQSTDFDFDGNSYRKDWAGTGGPSKRPTPWLVESPVSRDPLNGKWDQPYPQIRFEADLPRIEASDFAGHCNRSNGHGCVNPPPGAAFYPWFHSVSARGGCAWALSDNVPNQISNFGGEEAEFGPLELTNYGAFSRYNNFSSSLLPNTC
jgi:hypothetical protein